mgnify:CR=1 FL=1
MSARSELESIKAELASIINELEDIAAGVRSDFQGVGSEYCAQALEETADGYRKAKRYLEQINAGYDEIRADTDSASSGGR